MADAYAAGAKANAQLMQKYTWKMRVQLTYKGEQKPASLYQMNYVGGQLQKTEISAPPEESGRKHGIKHRVKEDKMAEIKSQVEALIELTKKYMAPTPGPDVRFLLQGHHRARVQAAASRPRGPTSSSRATT